MEGKNAKRAAVLAAILLVTIAAYFAFSLYLLPEFYRQSIQPRKPAPEITWVAISAPEIRLGESFTISVTGINNGQEADMQTVSLAFPNFTRTDGFSVVSHDFLQAPLLIAAGNEVGSQYAGPEKPDIAQYASVEAYSRPWEAGKSYSIKVEVTPGSEGRFVIFVKSVGLPHVGDQAHYPRAWPAEETRTGDGVALGAMAEAVVEDSQQELVQVYSVQVRNATKA